jgi:hypothetical protein
MSVNAKNGITFRWSLNMWDCIWILWDAIKYIEKQIKSIDIKKRLIQFSIYSA